LVTWEKRTQNEPNQSQLLLSQTAKFTQFRKNGLRKMNNKLRTNKFKPNQSRFIESLLALSVVEGPALSVVEGPALSIVEGPALSVAERGEGSAVEWVEPVSEAK
jgi:hypothetical protein